MEKKCTEEYPLNAHSHTHTQLVLIEPTDHMKSLRGRVFPFLLVPRCILYQKVTELVLGTAIGLIWVSSWVRVWALTLMALSEAKLRRLEYNILWQSRQADDPF